jgi:hypothetical protein
VSLLSSRRSRLLFWNALGVAGLSWLVACGPSLSQIPLFNAAPEGPGEYLYGPEQLLRGTPGRDALNPRESGASAAKTAAGDPKGQAGEGRKKRRDKDEASGKTQRAAASSSASTSTESGDAGVDKPPAKAVLAIAGDYRGTDRLLIRVGDETAAEEVDPKARVRVEASEDSDGDYVVSVLDSNTGDTLCGLTGTAEGSTIRFEPDQVCFEGTLGIDATTSLKGGEASISGTSLSVTFEITLLAFDDDSDDGDDGDDDDDGETAAATAIEVGTVKYRFDGKRE